MAKWFEFGIPKCTKGNSMTVYTHNKRKLSPPTIQQASVSSHASYTHPCMCAFELPWS